MPLLPKQGYIARLFARHAIVIFILYLPYIHANFLHFAMVFTIPAIEGTGVIYQLAITIKYSEAFQHGIFERDWFKYVIAVAACRCKSTGCSKTGMVQYIDLNRICASATRIAYYFDYIINNSRFGKYANWICDVRIAQEIRWRPCIACAGLTAGNIKMQRIAVYMMVSLPALGWKVLPSIPQSSTKQ